MQRHFPVLLAAAALYCVPAAATAFEDPRAQLEFELKSGNYMCEFGQRVGVQRDIRTGNNVLIAWKGGSYRLLRDASYSGLPRYEDRRNGLVWIDLPWKGVLLDARTQTPLANECKTSV